MTGLDCNILVQLALQDHPANAATVAAAQAETQRGKRLVFPSLVIDEFLHVITDERRFSPALTMVEALDWMEHFLSTLILERADRDTGKPASGAALDASV